MTNDFSRTKNINPTIEHSFYVLATSNFNTKRRHYRLLNLAFLYVIEFDV